MELEFELLLPSNVDALALRDFVLATLEDCGALLLELLPLLPLLAEFDFLFLEDHIRPFMRRQNFQCTLLAFQ